MLSLAPPAIAKHPRHLHRTAFDAVQVSVAEWEGKCEVN
jgi:hypothetical protein